MDVLIYLIPAALFLGLLGLVCFVWALRSGQFDDLDGAAHRILFDQDPESDRTAAGETPAPSRRDTDPAG